MITVTNTNDNGLGSLRNAIETAQPGDIIQFDASLAGQTITLTSGQLEIDKSLTIDGQNAPDLIISGNQTNRVFDIQIDANFQSPAVSLKNLIIADGKAQGPVTEGTLVAHFGRLNQLVATGKVNIQHVHHGVGHVQQPGPVLVGGIGKSDRKPVGRHVQPQVGGFALACGPGHLVAMGENPVGTECHTRVGQINQIPTQSEMILYLSDFNCVGEGGRRIGLGRKRNQANVKQQCQAGRTHRIQYRVDSV